MIRVLIEQSIMNVGLFSQINGIAGRSTNHYSVRISDGRSVFLLAEKTPSVATDFTPPSMNADQGTTRDWR